MAATDKVRKAVPEDLSQISTALSRAFLDDPVMSWAIPDEQRRQRILPDFFSLYTEVFLRHDESYTTREEVIGAALWAPPGRLPVSGEDAEDFGRRMEEMAGVDAPRFLEVGKLVDDYHPHGSYYYLQFLGSCAWPAGPGHRCCLDGASAGALRPRGHARVPGGHQRAQQEAVRAAWVRGGGYVRSSRGAAAVADVATAGFRSLATSGLGAGIRGWAAPRGRVPA
jgi:hypothetical protein